MRFFLAEKRFFEHFEAVCCKKWKVLKNNLLFLQTNNKTAFFTNNCSDAPCFSRNI